MLADKLKNLEPEKRKKGNQDDTNNDFTYKNKNQ
jgi:hypothetical protein